MHSPRPLTSRLTLVVALLALLVAVGSTSYAAGLAKNSVGTLQLKRNAVTAVKIKDGTVTGAEIKDGTVTGAEIEDGTVTGAEIEDGTVTGTDIEDGTVTGAEIEDGTVTGAEIEDGAVTGADIKDGSVLPSDLAPDPGSARVVSNDRVLPYAAAAEVALVNVAGLRVAGRCQASTRSGIVRISNLADDYNGLVVGTLTGSGGTTPVFDQLTVVVATSQNEYDSKWTTFAGAVRTAPGQPWISLTVAVRALSEYEPQQGCSMVVVATVPS